RNPRWNSTMLSGPLAAPTPIRGIFVACCASSGWQSAKSMAQRVRTLIVSFMCFFSASSTCHSTLDTCLFSLDHLIRTRQHVRWNREADLLRCLQVDHKLELRRLLDGKVRWLCAFQDFIDVRGGSPEQVGHARAVGYEPPVFHIFWPVVYRREP